MPRPSAAVRVGVIYVMFGIAWIVLSDFISAQFSPSGSAFLSVQTFKGIVFVLVSGVLISFLAAHPATRIEDDPKPSSGRIPLLIFLLLALAIAVTGVSTYVLLRQTIRDDTQRNLGAVAELKARQIADWLSDYQRNAWAIIQGPQFVALLGDSLAQGSEAWREAAPRLQQRLDFMRVNYGFDAIMLLDSNGRVLLTSGFHPPPDHSAALIAESQTPGLHLRDFHLAVNAEGQAHPELALFGRVGPTTPGADTVMYLVIDPELFLFPLVQEWPTASDTAETLLIRREGDEVVYLNDLRHRQGTALKLRRPLADAQLPAARAAGGHQGVFEGLDYRGVPVLAYLKAIPGTDWLMVSKIDAKEAYAALDQLALAAAGLGGGFLVAAGLALRFWWRFEQHARLARLAFHDTLTGLPNRALFHERLNAALALAERHRHQVAVGMLDLDHFKHVNDSLGHHVGDALLQEMARRMMACVREEDTVARPGGDEFMLVLPETGADGAAHVAEKIVRRIAEPMRLDGHELNISCSLGLSLFPDNGHNREILIQNADAAMYRAKQRGRNAYQFFTEEMHREAVKTLTLEQHLRKALERDELLLCYQPQVNARSGVMVGAEALVRWHHADWGLLLPSQFIPLAEECGLIHSLSLWVLRRVATQIKTWQHAGLPLHPIAVNLSASQFRPSQRRYPLRELVTDALDESGIAPGCLELEITESSLMEDTEQAVATLRELRDLGVRLTIDDFGTGYSSLGYLKRFPVERLKIDQSFIHELADNPGAESIVDTIIGLAHNLKFDVIAEGVENEAQWRKIRDKGCQGAQGYYFSRPLPPAELELWLAQPEHPNLPVIGETSQVLH